MIVKRRIPSLLHKMKLFARYISIKVGDHLRGKLYFAKVKLLTKNT